MQYSKIRRTGGWHRYSMTIPPRPRNGSFGLCLTPGPVSTLCASYAALNAVPLRRSGSALWCGARYGSHGEIGSEYETPHLQKSFTNWYVTDNTVLKKIHRFWILTFHSITQACRHLIIRRCGSSDHVQTGSSTSQSYKLLKNIQWKCKAFFFLYETDTWM